MMIITILLLALALPLYAATLTWQDKSDNEDGFQIQRSENGGAMATIGAVGVDVTGYEDATITETAKYCYQVRAFRGEYVSEPTNVECTVIAPGNLKVRK